MVKWFIASVLAVFSIFSLKNVTHAQEASQGISQVCPFTGVQQRGQVFEPGGIILTSFDRSALWVYNVDTNRRYPLPDTTPCGANCRLSPDARWITYYNRQAQTFNRMRIDGTGRAMVTEAASDVEWWGEDRFFVWTPAHRAYIQNSPEDRVLVNVEGITSVQPNGNWAIHIEPSGDGFTRYLGDMNRQNSNILLGVDMAYFNAYAWSPNGETLAFVAPVNVTGSETIGGEIFIVQPAVSEPIRMTRFNDVYDGVRINGLAVGEFNWSPDGTQIAFWVTPLNGEAPSAATAEAQIHILNINTGEIRAYCGFTTTEHTPNTPRLIWSPDGTHLAFSGNVVDDERGYLILALAVETGTITDLSEGVFPNFGRADLVAWGLY